MIDKIVLLRERASRLPRVSLSPLPTPLHECPRLAEALGGKVRLFMKRDDLLSVGLGGNKVRKLEFSLGRAKAEGCDVVVHGLAGQSNYCRLTAAACAAVGIPCYLILRKDQKAEDPPQANRLLDYIFGARVTMVPSLEQQSALARLVEELKAQGHKPYRIGHDDEVLGAVAYSLALAEIIEQMAAVGAKADCVCVTGWNGTQAGLMLGKRLLGFEGPVLGFLPAPEAGNQERHHAAIRIAQEAAALLGFQETFSVEDFHNSADYGGPKYGVPTKQCLEAISLLGRTEGLVVGPTYTAKGLAGTIDYIRTGRIAPGQTAVFLHTGGTPEVFAFHAEIAAALM